MLHSVGEGRFIERRGEKAALVVELSRVWNAASEDWDVRYRTLRLFGSFNEALNYAYRQGSFAVPDEMEAERRQAALIARQLRR